MTKPTRYKHGYKVNTFVNGRRVQKRFAYAEHADPRAAAEDYLERLKTEGPPDPEIRFDGLIDKYLDWSLNIQRKSSDTVRRDRQRLGVFVKWATSQKVVLPRMLTVRHIQSFQEYFFENSPFTSKPNHRKRFNANPHANWEKYRQNVSAFLNWCVSRGYSKGNPVIKGGGFRIKLQKNLPRRILSQDELRTLFGYFDDFASVQVATFFRMAAMTGMRLGELMELKWRDVDFPNNRIRVVKSKSKDVRSIPISSKLLPCLVELPQETMYVFDSGENSPLYASSWWLRVLNNAMRACGLPPARIHDLRHTFGSMLASEGVDIVTIKNLMGHSDIKSTMIYLHYSPAHMDDAIEKLPF